MTKGWARAEETEPMNPARSRTRTDVFTNARIGTLCLPPLSSRAKRYRANDTMAFREHGTTDFLFGLKAEYDDSVCRESFFWIKSPDSEKCRIVPHWEKMKGFRRRKPFTC